MCVLVGRRGKLKRIRIAVARQQRGERGEGILGLVRHQLQAGKQPPFVLVVGVLGEGALKQGNRLVWLMKANQAD